MYETYPASADKSTTSPGVAHGVSILPDLIQVRSPSRQRRKHIYIPGICPSCLSSPLYAVHVRINTPTTHKTVDGLTTAAGTARRWPDDRCCWRLLIACRHALVKTVHVLTTGAVKNHRWPDDRSWLSCTGCAKNQSGYMSKTRNT